MSNLPSEPEFEQALHEVEQTLAPFLKRFPEYKKALEIVQIPERIIQFRVVWEDDNHVAQVNRGYRVQFNSALGPYKGGLRLHETVNLSVLKFLGFEQIFKNALTGLSMGGGKGGSDFSPKGKSPAEVRRFVKAFATELSRHIGANTDVPAGDIGFSTREGGFLFGTYKQIKNEWTGIITGKALDWGGSHVRPEATGYGVVYYVEHMINHAEGKDSKGFSGKKVVISGSGQVAQFAALKVMELGATVLSLSDSKGSLVVKDPSKSFTKEMIEKVYQIKYDRKELSSLGDEGGLLEFHPNGARPWQIVKEYDVALPCATQNEFDAADAKAAIERGCKFVAEGSNMGVDAGGIDVLEKSRQQGGCWYGPGKAANAGGVATSGLEMAQNSQRLTWKPEEVDQKLREIMKNCYDLCFSTGLEYPADGDEQKQLPSLVQGANIAGFKRVADAMLQHGDFF